MEVTADKKKIKKEVSNNGDGEAKHVTKKIKKKVASSESCDVKEKKIEVVPVSKKRKNLEEIVKSPKKQDLAVEGLGSEDSEDESSEDDVPVKRPRTRSMDKSEVKDQSVKGTPLSSFELSAITVQGILWYEVRLIISYSSIFHCHLFY